MVLFSGAERDDIKTVAKLRHFDVSTEREEVVGSNPTCVRNALTRAMNQWRSPAARFPRYFRMDI